jgi:hypothetical protein
MLAAMVREHRLAEPSRQPGVARVQRRLAADPYASIRVLGGAIGNRALARLAALQRTPKCGYSTGLTRDDAIPITWFKPVHDSFYPKQIQVRNGVLDRDDPNAKLPDGTPVGVKRSLWPRLGKTMQLLPERRTGKQAEFKKTLADAGYDWEPRQRGRGTVMEPDHVQDLDWEGPDQFGNLWPYEASTNKSTGSTQNLHQRVSFCRTKESSAPDLDKRIVDVKPVLAGRHFVIRRFAMHS